MPCQMNNGKLNLSRMLKRFVRSVGPKREAVRAYAERMRRTRDLAASDCWGLAVSSTRRSGARAKGPCWHCAGKLTASSLSYALAYQCIHTP
jgi:hypothetical protein